MATPTYGIVADDIIEVQVLGRMYQQRTRTTFHYLYQGPNIDDGRAEMEAVAASFDTLVFSTFRGLLSSDWMHESTTCQLISPVRYRLVPTDVNLAGELSDPALPPSSTVVIRRQGIKSGKRYQGRIYIPGIPGGSAENGQLKSTVRDAWDEAATNLVTELSATVDGGTFVPVIHFKDTVTTLDKAVFHVVDYVLRSQRRREIGVGE